MEGEVVTLLPPFTEGAEAKPTPWPSMLEAAICARSLPEAAAGSGPPG